MSNPVRIVTSSWDDGNPLDVKVARLLRKHQVKGTFYVLPPLRNRSSLSESEIRMISENFEIGSHTITHPNLRQMPRRDVLKEIAGSKNLLEDIIRKRVEMFCYPMGLYNRKVIRSVKEAGYVGARTMACFSVSRPRDPFRLPTTVVVGPINARMKVFQVLRYSNLEGFYHSARNHRFKGWLDLAKYFARYMFRHGGVFHFWGHSKGVEELDLWAELDELLRYVSNRKSISYLTNGDLVRAITRDLSRGTRTC